MIAHLLFESLAYMAAFQAYRLLKRRRGDVVGDSQRWTVIAAAILGAAVGSKLLHHAAHPALLSENWRDPAFLMGGKTLVGALLGGTLTVEVVKSLSGITTRTGDLFAVPLCLGIAIGRLGCVLSGIHDDTHGLPTTFYWGVDFGDGIARHPVRLIEIAFALVLGAALLRFKPRRTGESFRLCLMAYLTFRFVIDFLKPYEIVGGLRVIQWACLAGVAWQGVVHLRELRLPRSSHPLAETAS